MYYFLQIIIKNKFYGKIKYKSKYTDLCLKLFQKKNY